jgi:lycopene beta-cyclase
MAQRWDAVIVGAGAAGLALAARLASGGWRERRVLLVDDGSTAIEDRSWAYWSAVPRPVDAAAAVAVNRFRLHALGRGATVPLGRYRYRQVRGVDLRAWVDRSLATAPGFVIADGHVDAVDDGDDHALVRFGRPAGREVEAEWVFDARRPGGPPAVPELTLSFCGWEVETERPVFDPSAVTLFDFRTERHREGRFVYLLPTGSRTALVEYTAFSRQPAEDGSDALAAYLSEVLDAGQYRVTRVERGALPLGRPATRRSGRRALRIGVAGGLLKAGTGYAFDRIQRDAEAVVASLRTYGHPYALPVPARRHRYLDQVLLRVLAAEPQQLERVFAQLFRANPAERVLRFLDEDTTRVEEARLIATLRPAPFLRAARSLSGDAFRKALG